MLIQYAAAIFFTALVGGLLPLFLRWTDRLLHSILALSTGIFLGAVFLHMLPSLSQLENGRAHAGTAQVVQALQAGAPPETLRDAPEAGGGGDHAAHGDTTLWLFVLIGVLAVYLAEALFLRSHDHDDLHRHRAVSYAALLGLSIHSLTNGIGLAAASQVDGMAQPFFVGIVAHKAAETFSLTTIFKLAQFPARRIVAMLVPFCLVAPAGILIGKLLTDALPSQAIGIITALAAGTFLYVCLCELLPEVFHHKEDIVAKIALLAGGIGFTMLLHEVVP